MVDDPVTDVILLMAEGIRRLNEFMAVAREALNKNKPIFWSSLGARKWANGKRFRIRELWLELMKYLTRCATACPDTVPDFGRSYGNDLSLHGRPLSERQLRRDRCQLGGMKGLICDHAEELNTNLAN